MTDSSTKDAVLAVRLPEDLKRFLQDHARTTNTTMSAVVVRHLQELRERERKVPQF